MVLSINFLIVTPNIKATDPPRIYPEGVCGTPPDVYIKNNVPGWTYQPYNFIYGFIWGTYGIYTSTPFNYEIFIPGPLHLYSFDLLGTYIKSNNLIMEEIIAYRPIFYLESTSWYSHRLKVESSVENSFTAEYKLGISSVLGGCSIYQGHSQTTSTTISGGWTEPPEVEQPLSNGNWRVIYLRMVFLRIHGTLTFFNNEQRTYDAIIMVDIDFNNKFVTKSELGDFKELPQYADTKYYDHDGDGEPDKFYDINVYFNYATVQSTTNYFGIKLEYNGKYFGMNGEAKFTYSSSSGLTLRHTFNGEVPSNHHFKIAMNNYFTLRVEIFPNDGGGGGDGCPILSVYNGNEFIEEGLLDIHNLDGIDQITNHSLTTTPMQEDSKYILKLTEHTKTISNIDQVQLLGKLQNGKLIPLELVYANHSSFGDVLYYIKFSDDNGVIIKGADYNNGISEYIELGFKISRFHDFNELIFTIEGNNYLVK